MILSELELRVLAADAQRVVNGQQLLLASLGSHGTTCLGQQILAGERTSRLGVIPSAIQLTLLNLDTTDNKSQQAVNGVLRAETA